MSWRGNASFEGNKHTSSESSVVNRCNPYYYKENARNGTHRRKESVKQKSISDESSSSCELLTREELFELPAKKLRKLCRRHGLNAKKAVEKDDLVDILHSFYRRSVTNQMNNSQHPTHTVNIIQRTDYRGKNLEGNGNFDDTEEIIDILHEIIPFFGQGDLSIDNIVKESIARLPNNHLDARDKMGNTIMMLCCRFGAFDQIPLLLSRGSDPNSQNLDRETCLHFACYSDSYSPETVEVCTLYHQSSNCYLRQLSSTFLIYVIVSH